MADTPFDLKGLPFLNKPKKDRLLPLAQAVQECADPKKILIVGSAFVDVVVEVKTLPKSAEDAQGQLKKTQVGGCSFNAADVLYKLKVPFDHLMPVGQGIAGNLVREEFKSRGYPLFETDDLGDNGWCLSLVESSGERTFISMSGVEQKFDEAWFERFDLDSYDYIYLSGYQAEGDNGRTILKALQKTPLKGTIVFDPGPRVLYIAPEVIEGIEKLGCIYDLNEYESLVLTSADNSRTAAKLLSKRNGHPAIVTCGKDGAILAEGNRISAIPGYKISVADTIGSGDSHTGALLAALSCGLSFEDAVLLANYVSASVTARSGAACAPYLDEILQHLRAPSS